MNKKERIILILLAALNFTHIMDFMIMMPLGNFLMPHFDISAQQFSMLVAAYTFSAATASLTAASFVDRFDRKKVLMFAYAGIKYAIQVSGNKITRHEFVPKNKRNFAP